MRAVIPSDSENYRRILGDSEQTGIFSTTENPKGRDSSVDISTRHGLDGPGIESRWVTKCSTNVQTGSGSYPASYTMGAGSFPGVKRPERGVDHPPTSTLKKKKSYTSTLPLGLRGLYLYLYLTENPHILHGLRYLCSLSQTAVFGCTSRCNLRITEIRHQPERY